MTLETVEVKNATKLFQDDFSYEVDISCIQITLLSSYNILYSTSEQNPILQLFLSSKANYQSKA